MTPAQITSPDLLDVLRARKEQASLIASPYAPRMARDTMLHWLAEAARQAREAAGRKQVHVGATINRDQSAVYRFEQANAWPSDPDLMITGYAEDLDISPLDLWQKALDMWREADATATVAEITERREQRRNHAAAADAAEAIEGAAGRERAPTRGTSARKRRAKAS